MPTFKQYNLNYLMRLPTITIYTVLQALGVRYNGRNDPLLGQMARWIWTSENEYIVGYNERAGLKIVIELGAIQFDERNKTHQMQYYYKNGNLENLVDVELFNFDLFKYWVSQGK